MGVFAELEPVVQRIQIDPALVDALSEPGSAVKMSVSIRGHRKIPVSWPDREEYVAVFLEPILGFQSGTLLGGDCEFQRRV